LKSQFISQVSRANYRVAAPCFGHLARAAQVGIGRSECFYRVARVRFECSQGKRNRHRCGNVKKYRPSPAKMAVVDLMLKQIGAGRGNSGRAIASGACAAQTDTVCRGEIGLREGRKAWAAAQAGSVLRPGARPVRGAFRGRRTGFARRDSRIGRASQKRQKFNTKIATNLLTDKTVTPISCGLAAV